MKSGHLAKGSYPVSDSDSLPTSTPDSIPAAIFPGEVGHLSLEDTGSAAGSSAASSRGHGSTGTAADELQQAAMSVPGLSREQLLIAELAHGTQPILIWQLNLRLRKLGVKETFDFLSGIGRINSKYRDPDYTAKNRQAVEDLVTSKGGQVDLATKAAHQWSRITGTVANHKFCGYCMGQHSIGEDDIQEIEQFVKRPEYADLREAVQVMLLAAREIVYAGQSMGYLNYGQE